LAHAQKPRFGNDSALITSASAGHTAVVRLLLECPENAPLSNCQLGLPMWSAAGNGHVETVRLLLEWPLAQRNGFQGPMIIAASNGHDEVVRLLLEWPGDHAPLDYPWVIDCAKRHGHDAVVRLLQFKL
jgi:ankyrin repeat protein